MVITLLSFYFLSGINSSIFAAIKIMIYFTSEPGVLMANTLELNAVEQMVLSEIDLHHNSLVGRGVSLTRLAEASGVRSIHVLVDALISLCDKGAVIEHDLLFRLTDAGSRVLLNGDLSELSVGEQNQNGILPIAKAK